MTDTLSRIDDTLTFHSAGLGGVDLKVPVERDELDDLAAFMEVCGFTLSEWQREVLAAPPVLIDVDYFEQRGVSAAAIAAVLARHALMDGNVYVVSKRAHAAEDRRRARLRRMHHLYRMRRVR